MAESPKLIEVFDIKKQEIQRKDGKGTFTQVTLIGTDSEEYSGYANQLPKDLKVGDKCTVICQKGSRKDGSKYNKIVATNPTASSVNASAENKMPWAPKAEYNKTFDNKGARVGGVIHDAVAIAIHNSGKNKVDMETVRGLAKELLDVAKDLDNK